MGARKTKPPRVVLDTSVLLSALLFKGATGPIADLWRKGRIVPLCSRETFQEFSRALRCPKFSLTVDEIRTIVEQYVVPYVEVVQMIEGIEGVCADPDDDKFIACGVSGKADFIVSGDSHLLAVGQFRSLKIVSVAEFLCHFPEQEE